MVNSYTRQVLLERARLALTDPAGEAEALVPMSEAEALDIITWRPTEGPASVHRVGHRMAVDRDEDLAVRLSLPILGYGMAHCPAHEDRSRSLSYRWTEGGRLLLHCFAGCTWEEITA